MQTAFGGSLVQKIILESRRFHEPNMMRASPMYAMCTSIQSRSSVDGIWWHWQSYILDFSSCGSPRNSQANHPQTCKGILSTYLVNMIKFICTSEFPFALQARGKSLQHPKPRCWWCASYLGQRSSDNWYIHARHLANITDVTSLVVGRHTNSCVWNDNLLRRIAKLAKVSNLGRLSGLWQDAKLLQVLLGFSKGFL